MSSHDRVTDEHLAATSAEQRLDAAIREGRPVVYRASDARLRATYVRRAVAESGTASLLHVSGALIDGALDLTSMPLRVLVLTNCTFETLTLDNAHARRVVLQGCTGGEVSAMGLVVDEDLTFDTVTVTDTIDLSRAHIGRHLVCRDLEVGREGGTEGQHPALVCRRAKVGDDMDLLSCMVRGGIDLVRAEVSGTFTYTGRLECRDGVALRCDGMHVKGDLNLGDPDPALNDESHEQRTEINGGVRFVGAEVEKDAYLTQARIHCPGGTALDGLGLTVGDGLYLDYPFKVIGLVQLAGATVSRLSCTGGAFCNKSGPAIDGDGLVATDVYFNSWPSWSERRFVAEGGIRLIGARISGSLMCSGAEIATGDGRDVAIQAGRLACEDLYLNDCVTKGSVSLWGATIGHLDCRGGSIRKAERVATTTPEIEWYETYGLELAETEIRRHILGNG